MKKVIPVLLILFSTWLLPCVTACAPAYPFERFELTYFEPGNRNQGYLLSGKKTEVDGSVVYFDDSYSTRRQNNFLRFAEATFGELEIQEPLTYYVGKGYACRADAETNTVYLNTDDKTVFLHTTLQLFTSTRLNYGTLWGMSEAMRAKLSDEKFSADHKSAKKSLGENIDLLDLTALRFLSPYSDKREIKQAKTVANSFTEWLLSQKGEMGVKNLIEQELLALDDAVAGEAFERYNTLFTTYKNEYLDFLGLDATVQPADFAITYEPYTLKYPVLIGTDWGVLYLESDYDNPYDNELYGDLMRRWSDYSASSMQAIIQKLDETVRTVLTVFGYTMSDLQPKFNYFLDDRVYEVENLGGYVDVYAQTVNMCNFVHFAHEFGHVLESVSGFYSMDNMNYDWLGEGVAEYISLELAPAFYEYEYCVYELDLTYSYELIGEFYETLRPSVESDLRGYKDALAYFSVKENMHLDKTYIRSAYWRYTSFVYWLVDRFGLEKIIEVIKKPDSIERVFGAKQGELWREWGSELFARANDAAPESFLEWIR